MAKFYKKATQIQGRADRIAWPQKPTQVPLHHGQSQPWPRAKKRTDSKKGPFLGRFGRKTGGPRKKNDTFFRVFSVFRDFLPCKPLRARSLQGLDPSPKNRA
jgi:hypothetical protein